MSNQTTVATVTLGIRVPGCHDEATLAEIIGRLIGTGQGACDSLVNDPECGEDANLARSINFARCDVKIEMVNGAEDDGHDGPMFC